MYNDWEYISGDLKEKYIERAKYIVDRNYVDEEDYEVVARKIFESEKSVDKSEFK